MGIEKQDGSSSPNHLLVRSVSRDDTPLIPKSSKNLSSLPKTFANVFMSIVGAGVLGLPYSFKRTGWVSGIITLFAVSTLTYHCMMLLVYTRRKLESNDRSCTISSFGDLGFVVCGPNGRFAVDTMIVLSQAGFCIGYLIFIANTLTYVLDLSEDQNILGLTAKSFYIWSCFPFQLALNWIPTLTHLAPLSIFADVVDMGAIGTVMVEDVLVLVKNHWRWPALRPFGSSSMVFYGLGVSIYTFEGIGMVLPLESETEDKENFGKVLGLSMGFISFMYAVFGALGYFAFGEETKDIITTNLGRGLVINLVQLGLCVNLIFTFPLMMNPVYEVVERRLSHGRYCLWLRWMMVLGVSLVALLVPNFADFLSLMGSSVCCVLALVLPALFHLMVFKDEMKWESVAFDGLIVIFGAVLVVTGTWSSLADIYSSEV